MGDDVNGAWMSGIKDERATRYLFGTTILAVLLEGECVHRKDARIAWQCGMPFGQHVGETHSHHAPLAEVKVELAELGKASPHVQAMSDFVGSGKRPLQR